jgi:hypothetical protein
VCRPGAGGSSSQLLSSASEFSPSIISADGILGARKGTGARQFGLRGQSGAERAAKQRDEEFAAARRAPSLATRAGYSQRATVICRRSELCQIPSAW